MKFAWIGFHEEGAAALNLALHHGYRPEFIITHPLEQSARRSSFYDYSYLAERHEIPLHYVKYINSEKSKNILRDANLEFCFVIGWSQILDAEVLSLAKSGFIGAHASPLPRGRGSAPINWAIFQDEKITGNTLFWLTPEVDEGNIIAQTRFPISQFDTCNTIYKKVSDSNGSMVLEFLDSKFNKPGEESTFYTRRKPENGQIDWSLDSKTIYNFIRALTHPYPGAFSSIDGVTYSIWEASCISHSLDTSAEPGSILEFCPSPNENACGLLVTCGKGSLFVNNMSMANKFYTGPQLENLNIVGKTFTD